MQSPGVALSARGLAPLEAHPSRVRSTTSPRDPRQLGTMNGGWDSYFARATWWRQDASSRTSIAA